MPSETCERRHSCYVPLQYSNEGPAQVRLRRLGSHRLISSRRISANLQRHGTAQLHGAWSPATSCWPVGHFSSQTQCYFPQQASDHYPCILVHAIMTACSSNCQTSWCLLTILFTGFSLALVPCRKQASFKSILALLMDNIQQLLWDFIKKERNNSATVGKDSDSQPILSNALSTVTFISDGVELSLLDLMRNSNFKLSLYEPLWNVKLPPEQLCRSIYLYYIALNACIY